MKTMDTAQTIFATFIIAAVIATGFYFVVIYRKKRGVVNKHPHFDPHASHNHNPGNNGGSNPTATRVNGGYNGGGGLGG